MEYNEAGVIRQIKTYGYGVARQIVSPEIVNDLKLKVNKIATDLSHVKYSGVPVRDARDGIVYNLQNKDVAFIRILSNPAIRNILMTFLNDPYYRFLPPDKPNYILSYYNARSSGNKLDLHIDSYIPAHSDFTWSMQVVFVLDRFTEDNGATVVVPGSHQSGKYTDRDLTRDQMQVLLAEPGDVIFWDSRLWHGTLENVSGASRWALIATITQWWIKQSTDITRMLPQEIYQQLSDEERALMGYCSMPPRSEYERINTKCGYEYLKNNVSDYFE
jgi:hypothetical protein